MDSIREQKQQYLREKIIDQNYDPTEFMDFCESTVGGADIDEWSFERLVKIVEDFINFSNKEKEQANNPSLGFDNNIANEFSQWDNYIQEAPTKQEEQKFELNLLDLDFLDGLSGTNKSVSNNFVPPKTSPVTEANKNYMSVPSGVAKKLQEGNNNFIVGYNSMSLNQAIPKEKNISESPSKEQKKSESNYVSPSREIQNEIFEKKITCKKIMNKSRLTGNEDVLISGHEIVNPNVFVPKYVLFYITVNPQNIEVKRRLKDFESLRSLLKKFFPTSQIPHLERCSRLSETEPATIKKQTLFLESFLNDLIMKTGMKSKLVEEFLLCKDLDILKKLFKEYEKLTGPKSLETLFSPDGELELKLSPENRKFINEHLNLNEAMKEHFTKMKGLYDTLIEGFEQNIKTIADIEELHKSFKERIKTVNSQFTPDYQCNSLEKSIERVELMHKQWAASFKTQARIIKTEIRHLYRFEQDNVSTLADLLKFEEEITSSYNKRSDKDQANREPYESRRLDEYKIVIDSPSKNITVLKHQAAYLQEKGSRECLEYLEHLAKKLDIKYKLFCTMELSICKDMENVWSQFDNYYK